MRSLSNNCLGAAGAAALAPALAANGALTALDLSYNGLKDEGVSAVCEVIQSNKETKLASLNFKYNAIGPVGANSVAAMVSVTGSLTKMRYVTPQTKSEFGSDWTHIDIRGASDARLLVHIARVRVRVLRTCVMQPSVGLLSAFPHAACAAKERSFLTYPAIDTPYCSLQPDDAPSVPSVCVHCAALSTTASMRKPNKPSETHGGAPPPNWSSEQWYARNPSCAARGETWRAQKRVPTAVKRRCKMRRSIFSFFAKFDVWPTLLELSTEGRERMLCGEQFLVCDET